MGSFPKYKLISFIARNNRFSHRLFSVVTSTRYTGLIRGEGVSDTAQCPFSSQRRVTDAPGSNFAVLTFLYTQRSTFFFRPECINKKHL
jgi:hypothetical protein